MSTVQSVERAFAVLRALATGPAGVTELAGRVGLPKSTVARLLATLEDQGAVEQLHIGGTYCIGPSLVELASVASPRRSLVSRARPSLFELVYRTSEAAGLSVPDGVNMLYLDQLNPDGELQVRDWTGERIPMYAVPSGLVVLAEDPELEQLIAAAPMPPFTRTTIRTGKELAERLAMVREDGFAWAFEEFADGLVSVAAPVRNRDGVVVAALHVYGPSSRFPGKRSPAELGTIVAAIATRALLD